MIGLRLNEHGFYSPPNPLRFRNEQECLDFTDGKISVDSLPTPGTDEYDKAPYEQGYMVHPNAFKP